MKKQMMAMCMAFAVVSLTASAQKLAIEKTYTITGQAKRGYLDEVDYDANSKNTRLSFVTKSNTSITGSKTKVKYQNYYFDKEFNFLKMEEEEDVYRNKRYKGDNYSVEGVAVQNNFTGTFVLRKKLITYRWDWFFGGYKKKVKLLEKLKPKDDSGNKYTLVRKFENDQNGDVVVLVKAKGKKVDPNEYFVLKIDNQLNFTQTGTFKFNEPRVIVASYLISNLYELAQDDSGLDEEDEGNEADDTDDQGDLSTSDAGLVFATSQMGKKAGADPHDYAFVHINRDGQIVRKVDMKTGASVWGINQMIDTGESLYMMGPANEGKYIDREMPSILGGYIDENAKWKLFQLCRIKGDKVEYMTTTNLDEFEAKLKVPPSQKRTPSYRGKRFHFSNADIYKDGSIIICGQNYKREKKNNVQYKSYRDVITFLFDPQGKLKAQYGVRREENNKYAQAAPTMQLVNKGQNTIYWTVMEIDGVRLEREGKVKAVKALIYPNVARIDPNTGDISDFAQFGLENGKPKYYLHNGFPILPMSEENAVVYLGVDKPGKTLWFGKMVLD